MRFLRLTLITLTFLTASAAAFGQSSVELTTGELAVLEELAFEPFCPNPTNTSTVCLGDRLCKLGNDWKSPTLDGQGRLTCPRDYTLVTIVSVDQACTAATDRAEPANCPNPQADAGHCEPYCLQGDAVPHQSTTSTCCTVSRERTCTEVKPEKPPVDDTPGGERREKH